MWEIVVDKDCCEIEDVKTDNYEEVEYVEPCMICKNRGSEKCSSCCRN